MSIARRRITVGDECAQLAGGSLSLKVYPPHLAKLSPSAASGTVSRVNDLLIPPLPPAAGSPPGETFEDGIGQLENDEIMNFGIWDGVEHMEHIAVI